MEGFIEILEVDRIAGWAWLPTEPERPVEVEAWDHGVLVKKVFANIFRRDLVLAGIGLGFHGFEIHLRGVGSPDAVEVFARSKVGETKRLQMLQGANANPKSRPPILRSCESLALVDQNTDHKPVFILGSARSATSVIAQSLLYCTHFQGREEGHLFDMLAPLLSVVRQHYIGRAEEWNTDRMTLLADVDIEYFMLYIKSIFINIVKSLYPQGFWLDKTPIPKMISLAPLLLEIWPEARFIYMKRRGLENVVSRLAKFPLLSFEFHCRDWAQCMHIWTAVRCCLAGRAIEIDQAYLAEDAQAVANALSRFLDLSVEECARLAAYLTSSYPERTGIQYGERLELVSIGWADSQRDMFLEICGGAMKDFGYSMTRSYFQNDKEGGRLSTI